MKLNKTATEIYKSFLAGFMIACLMWLSYQLYQADKMMMVVWCVLIQVLLFVKTIYMVLRFNKTQG